MSAHEIPGAGNHLGLVHSAWHCPHACSISSLSSLFLALVLAYLSPRTVNLYRGAPLPPRFVPGNATIARCASQTTRDILEILPMGYSSQVSPAAVSPDTVDVVYFNSVAVNQSKNDAMQEERPWMSVSGSPSAGIPVAIQTPVPLTDKLRISSVDQGILSDAAISGAERDSRSQAICAEERGSRPRSSPPVATAVREWFSLADTQMRVRLLRHYRRQAASALTQRGIIRLHRTLHRSGARPRVVTIGLGLRRVNYIIRRPCDGA